MRYTTIIIAVLFLPFFVGCAQENPFGVVYVEGTVTYNGEPIQGVNVTFNPLDAGEQLSAGGLTDARGRFTLTAGGSPTGSGARPGSYDVTFAKFEIPQFESPEAQFAAIGDRQPEATHLIPERYGSPRTSGIEPVTVTTNRRDNVFNFNLTTAP